MSSILFLHGAGASDKNRTKYLEIILARYGIKCHSFNFKGAGGDAKEMSKSSLKQRQLDAERYFEKIEDKQVTVCGSSMGAYTAIKLTEKYKINSLVLFCPAVYTIEAFDVPFNDEFTKIISEKESLLESDAFEILENFQGKILIFIGSADEVIPKKLLDLLDESLNKLKSKEIVMIPDCPHAIHLWLVRHEGWAKKVGKKIVDFLA